MAAHSFSQDEVEVDDTVTYDKGSFDHDTVSSNAAPNGRALSGDPHGLSKRPLQTAVSAPLGMSASASKAAEDRAAEDTSERRHSHDAAGDSTPRLTKTSSVGHKAWGLLTSAGRSLSALKPSFKFHRSVRGKRAGTLPTGQKLENLLGKTTTLSREEVCVVRDMMRNEVKHEQELEAHEHEHRLNNSSSGDGGGGHRTPRESMWTEEDEIVALLKQRSNWTTDTLRELAAYFKIQEVTEGETIYEEGDVPSGFYVVMDGEVEICLSSIRICRRTSAQGFGWEALQPPTGPLGSQVQLRSYSAFAMCNGRLLKVDKSRCQIKAAWFYNDDPVQLPHFLRTLCEGERLIPLLRQTDLFGKLDPHKLRLISIMAESRELAPDDVLCDEGSMHDDIFLIVTGTVIVTQKDKEDGLEDDQEKLRDKKLGFLKRGDLIGIHSIFERNHVRTATVKAVTGGEAAVLVWKKMQWFLKQYPEETEYFRQIIDGDFKRNLRSSHVPLFEKLDRDTLDLLDEMSVINRAGPGVHLFEKDDIGECMYIIMEGSVDIFNDSKVNSLQADTKLPDDVVVRLGPGEYFGELALVSEGSKRKFGARVSEDSASGARLITVDKEGFTQIFKHHPQALAEIEMRILRDDVSIETILSHPEACRAFVEHMKSEFAEENVEFWSACRTFQRFFTIMKDEFDVNEEEPVLDDIVMDALREEQLLNIETDFTGLLVAVASESEFKEKQHLTDEEAEERLQAMVRMKRRMDIITNHADDMSRSEACSVLICYMRRHQVVTLVTKFIVEGAPVQININAAHRQRIEKCVKENLFPSTIFVEAQLEVLDLMKTDVLERFKAGKFFKNLLVEVGAYEKDAASVNEGKNLKELMRTSSQAEMTSQMRRTMVGASAKLAMASLAQDGSDGESDYEGAEVVDDSAKGMGPRRQTFSAGKTNVFGSSMTPVDDTGSDMRKTISIHSLAMQTQDADVPEIAKAKPNMEKSPTSRLRRFDSWKAT